MTNPYDWQDRLKHLDADGTTKKKKDEEPAAQLYEEPAEQHHDYRDPPEFAAEQSSEASARSLSFSASRKGKPKGKAQDNERGAASAHDVLSPDGRLAGTPLSTEALLAQLDKISPDQLLAAHKKNKQLIIASVAAVVLLVVITVATMPLHLPDVTKWCSRVCMLAVPLCIFFGVKEAIKMLMRQSPLKAQQLYSKTSWGDPRDIAFSYIDTADYLTAERVLEKACKTMSAKQAKQYISAYGLLGVIHAYTGRTDAAEKIIKNAVDISEAGYKARQTDSNSVLLAMSLNYTGELYELKGLFEDSLHSYTRGLQLTCSQLNPQGADIVIALANVGHLKNLLGRHAEALPVLRKAREIAEKMPDTRESVKAYVLSNLATACRGIGELEESAELFHQAIACANGPLGQRELGRVYYDLARLHVTADDHERGQEFYAKSVDAYDQWKPVASPEFVRVLQDYAYYLRSIERNDEADATKKRAAQMQQTLRDINHLNQGEVKKISASVVQSVAQTTKKPRFPIFWTLFFFWQCFSVYENGLRVAPYSTWMLLIACIAILTLKLKNKFSPPSREELSQGAAVALMSMIPFARSILPELSQLSKMGIAIFVVVILGLLGGVKMLLVPPNTVPQGLMPMEYQKLGENLAREESFMLARQAFDKGIDKETDPKKLESAKRIALAQLPIKPQPEVAIQANMNAKEMLENQNEAGAIKTWQECIKDYPDFEFPYVNLAKSYVKATKGTKPDKDKAKEADVLLTKALAINPNCYEALQEMGEVKALEGDTDASMEYTKKALGALLDKDDPAAKFSSDMIDAAASKVKKKSPADSSSDSSEGANSTK